MSANPMTTNDPVEIALRTYNMVRDGILLSSFGIGVIMICVIIIAINVIHG